jgi:hypothetical protein
MPTQKCPMCLQTKQVVSSHLMPADLYDYCRPPDGNPVSFNSRVVLESSRQMQHPLLCLGCEEILNQGGEQWMLPLFASLDGTFPFYDLLTRHPPAIVDGDAKLYAAAGNKEIDCDRVIHFALGIFWKAAVHSWRGGETDPLIDLGRQTENIRRYLKGEAGFPNDLALTIGVLPRPVKHISFVVPYHGSADARNNFLFYALGIEFTLLIGDRITPDQRAASFTGNPHRPILVVDFAPMVQEIAVQVMRKAHKAKNVRKYLKKA